MVRGVVRQEGGNLPGSMIQLEGAQTAAANEASFFRQGGKRPRTTSSIFATAATGMLTGRITPTAGASVPSFAKQQHAGHHEQQPEALFRLRGRMGSGRVSASAASDSSWAGSAKKRVIPGGTATANAAMTAATTTVFQSNMADAMILGGFSSQEALGEAAAMAADERRSSPSTPPPKRSVDYHRSAGGKGQAEPPQPTLIDDTPEGACSQAVPFYLRTQEDSDGCPVEAGAEDPGNLFIDDRQRGSSSPPAPAYEPSLLNEDNSTAGVSWRYIPERRLKETARRSSEEMQQQRNGSAAAHAKGGDLELAEANGFSSRTKNISSPQCQEVERDVRAEVEGDRHRYTNSPQQRVPAISNLEGARSPSPSVDRQAFLSTMKKSDDAHQRVRGDLLHYMEGVRAR